MANKSKALTEADESAKTSKPAVPSVEKALDVIEYLSETKDGATMKELIQGLDRTMGELYRIVVYLTEKEYLTLDTDTGRYSLTLKLFELSHRHDPVKQLISHAVPLMQRFSAMTEQSCHLGVLSGDNLLVLASESSPRAMGYSVRTGALFHMTDASSASVIVAHSDDDLKEEYLGHFSAGKNRKEAQPDWSSLQVNDMKLAKVYSYLGY
ncbi:transcriptional regulator IclR family [Vibrio variabilis]|uniref:Transcriptional regulator IclR family n=1 Tax=Vibrio variabilis TaxID=990271 RepID=A0ABQ0JES6_9VIBR|nr:transcriptional regulator IclR family [Vibrio variabilis]